MDNREAVKKKIVDAIILGSPRTLHKRDEIDSIRAGKIADQLLSLIEPKVLSDEQIIKAIDDLNTDIMFDPREYLVELRAISQATVDKKVTHDR